MTDSKRFLLRQTMWMGASLALSVLLSFFFPFYIALPILIGTFIAVNYYFRKRMMKRIGGFYAFERNSISYYCMACGTKHTDVSCPKCGSKMKRIG